MAPPVPFKQAVPPDARASQQQRIAEAPLDHADAVLSAYDLLQKLHEAGVLEILRGAAGARDALIEQLAAAASTPESLQAIRNLIVLGKALGGIDSGLLKAATAGTDNANTEPPSLWELARRARSKDARRGLAMAIGLLEALGKGLGPEGNSSSQL